MIALGLNVFAIVLLASSVLFKGYHGKGINCTSGIAIDDDPTNCTNGMLNEDLPSGNGNHENMNEDFDEETKINQTINGKDCDLKIALVNFLRDILNLPSTEKKEKLSNTTNITPVKQYGLFHEFTTFLSELLYVLFWILIVVILSVLLFHYISKKKRRNVRNPAPRSSVTTLPFSSFS